MDEESCSLPNYKPYIGMEFDSEEDAYNFYNLYGGYVGFHVRRAYRNVSPKDPTVITSRRFVCSKEGLKKVVCGSEGKKVRPETRTNCPAKMGIKRSANGKYRCYDLVEDHNHPLCITHTVHIQHPQRSMSHVQTSENEIASSSDLDPKDSCDFTADSDGGSEQENGGGTLHKQGLTPRKRVLPQSHGPPTKPLGECCLCRPLKTRSISQLREKSSNKTNNQLEEQSSKSNTSPVTLQQIWPASNMSPEIRNVTVDRNQESGGKICTSVPHDTEVETQVLNNDLSLTIDPKILQDVANALSYADKSQAAIEKTIIETQSANMGAHLSTTLKAINEKHGDIIRDCSLKSDYMKSCVLLGICKVVQDLEKQRLKDIDCSTLDSYYSTVLDAERMKLNVEWLRNQLDEIKDAINEACNILEEKNRLMENIENMRKNIQHRRVEMERLESEIGEIESKLALEIVMLEEVSRNMDSPTSKFQSLQNMPLMTGLT